MSTGVVGWPDDAMSESIYLVWQALDAIGCPSLAGTVQIPHLSFVVADDLDHDAVAARCSPVPAAPIPIDVSSVGVFPGGVVFFAVRPTVRLLAEHARVHDGTRGLLHQAWPYYAPDAWVPHLTLALDVPDVGTAVTTATSFLPLAGWISSGGIENGDTGARTVLST